MPHAFIANLVQAFAAAMEQGLRRGVGLVLVAGLTLAGVGLPVQAGEKPWAGVYELRTMLTFYIVNDDGADFEVTVRALNQFRTMADRPVMIRVLDTEERVVQRVVEPGLRTSGTPGWSTTTVPVTSSGPGVYQVIVTGFGNTTIHFEVSPALSWGVYGYPYLTGTGHLDQAYIFLPPNLSSLTARCVGSVESLTLTDADGIAHVSISGENAFGGCALPPGENQVWRLNATGPAAFGVSFDSAPIIACPDEATARTIRSSVEVLEDGTVCFHKFQRRAHDLLEQYRAKNQSEYAVSPPAFGAATTAWTSEPARTSLLLGAWGVYAALPAVLADQNLDPASPWFGSIHEWHDTQGAERPNPWLSYDRLGMTDPARAMSVLAAVYAVDDPVNPLFRSETLRNRVIVAALQQMMMIREHEQPQPIYIEYDGGIRAFDLAGMLRAFPWVIADCPGEVQSIWVEGARRMVDRMVLAAIPEIINQWSFIVMAIQNFAKGTGEQEYRGYVQMHINWILQRRLFGFGAMPAGYFSEGEGPDATYSGINLHNLAWLAEDTGSQPLKDAVIDAYTVFNHTVAPEPDGTWRGASSFCHRTPGDWTDTQSTAGAGMLADDSPEAAVLLGHCWMPRRPARTPAEVAEQLEFIQSLMQYLPVNALDDPNLDLCVLGGPLTPMLIWEHYMGTPLNGRLPMKASDRFTRKFGDEFFCVRRPSYYAFLYCGQKMEAYREAVRPIDPNIQYPRNGGGLSMLWSPKFGASILSKNWSAYSTNSIIAAKGAHTWFEDYWGVNATLQTSQSRSVVSGELTDDRMTYRRQLAFQEDRILCEIRLSPKQSITYQKLWECFPYPLDKPDPIKVSLYDAEGRKIAGNNKVASAIVFHNSANEVHVIAFSQPRQCEFGVNTSVDNYNNTRECGRVLTQLPAQWNAGQVRTVKWAARVVRPNQLQATIKQLVQSQQ